MRTMSLLTIEDIEHLREDAYHYERLQGELFRVSPSCFESSRTGMLVGTRLAGWAEERRLGWLIGAKGGCILARAPDTLLAPDVACIRKDRLPPRKDRGTFLTVPPDLVAEVRSPLESGPDIMDKVNAYLEAGVPLVWVLEPARLGGRVFRPRQPPRELSLDDDLDGEDILPGFWLPLAKVYRDLIEE
jgi:Uma2 family endonuclease